MRKARAPSSRPGRAAMIAAVAVTAIVVTAVTVARGATATTVPHARRENNGPPSVFPPPQILPVLGRGRAGHRLQGCEAAPALHLRARQDRAAPHHGRFGQEAA